MAVGTQRIEHLMTLAERWNGTEWSVVPMPPLSGAHASVVYGISCSSETACTAVGSEENSEGHHVPFAENWNGEKWTPHEMKSPSGATQTYMFSVSCSSGTACMAAGRYDEGGSSAVTLAESWNGEEWTIQTTPNPGHEGELSGVSCSSSSACTAVGKYTNNHKETVTLAERWTGTGWTVQSTPNPSGATTSRLDGVSCGSSTTCTAVGNSGGTMLAESWTGTEWKVQSTPGPAGAVASRLYGVSCSSLICTAAGAYETPTQSYTLAEGAM
jgi:hypothetical protein